MLATMIVHDASSPSPSRRCQTTSRDTGLVDYDRLTDTIDRPCGSQSRLQTQAKVRQGTCRAVHAPLRDLPSPGQTCSGMASSIYNQCPRGSIFRQLAKKESSRHHGAASKLTMHSGAAFEALQWCACCKLADDCRWRTGLCAWRTYSQTGKGQGSASLGCMTDTTAMQRWILSAAEYTEACTTPCLQAH